MNVVEYILAVAAVTPPAERAPGEPIGFVMAQGPTIAGGDRAFVIGVCRMDPNGFWQAAKRALREL